MSVSPTVYCRPRPPDHRFLRRGATPYLPLPATCSTSTPSFWRRAAASRSDQRCRLRQRFTFPIFKCTYIYYLGHAVLMLAPELFGDVLFRVIPGKGLVPEHLKRSVGERLPQHLLLGRTVRGRVLASGPGAVVLLPNCNMLD